jgi:hypothetical protein
MSDVTARLDLPLIKPSQAQKHVTHNEALQVLDGLVQAAIEQTNASTPPFEPVDGTLFALGSSPSGEWLDQGGKLAYRVAGGWIFINPEEGWRVWDKAAGDFKVFRAGAWAALVANFENLSGLGVGTTSDTTNRLAVSSDAVLFNHAGAGHQLKLNKANSGDTASLLFQSGFVGHAEMGLAGDTAFSIKVSDNGTNWFDAIEADASSGQIHMGFPVSGEAVQQSATDSVTGRLLKTGAAATVLSGGLEKRATVGGSADAIDLTTGANFSSIEPGFAIRFRALSQNSGPTTLNVDATGNSACTTISGTPLPAGYIRTDVDTVAIFDGTAWVLERQPEHGSNSDGDYFRQADGTLCVYGSAVLDFFDASTVEKDVTFPASFSDATKVAPSVSLETIFSTNADITKMAQPQCLSFLTSGFTVQIKLISGFSGFQSGDTVATRYSAIGRWY